MTTVNLSHKLKLLLKFVRHHLPVIENCNLESNCVGIYDYKHINHTQLLSNKIRLSCASNYDKYAILAHEFGHYVLEHWRLDSNVKYFKFFNLAEIEVYIFVKYFIGSTKSEPWQPTYLLSKKRRKEIKEIAFKYKAAFEFFKAKDCNEYNSWTEL